MNPAKAPVSGLSTCEGSPVFDQGGLERVLRRQPICLSGTAPLVKNRAARNMPKDETWSAEPLLQVILADEHHVVLAQDLGRRHRILDMQGQDRLLGAPSQERVDVVDVELGHEQG